MNRFTFLSAVLLISPIAYAQAPDNTSRPAQNPDTNSQSNDTSRSATTGGRKMTMTGCITERNGKYFLMTNRPSNQSGQSYESQPNEQTTPQSGQSNEQSRTSGTRFIELVSTQDLKTHLGHTVRVTGNMERSSAMSNDAGDTNSNPPNRSSDTAQNRSASSEHKHHGTFRVSDVEMVSESCNVSSPSSRPH